MKNLVIQDSVVKDHAIKGLLMQDREIKKCVMKYNLGSDGVSSVSR